MVRLFKHLVLQGSILKLIMLLVLLLCSKGGFSQTFPNSSNTYFIYFGGDNIIWDRDMGYEWDVNEQITFIGQLNGCNGYRIGTTMSDNQYYGINEAPFYFEFEKTIFQAVINEDGHYGAKRDLSWKLNIRFDNNNYGTFKTYNPNILYPNVCENTGSNTLSGLSTVKVGVTPPRPNEFSNSEGGDIISLTEKEPFRFTLKFIDAFNLDTTIYGTQIDYKVSDTSKIWIPYRNVVPSYSSLKEENSKGKRLYLRARIYRKNEPESNPVKYSPYQPYAIDVLPAVDVKLLGFDKFFCKEDSTTAYFKVGYIYTSDIVELYEKTRIGGNTDNYIFRFNGTHSGQIVPVSFPKIDNDTIIFDYKKKIDGVVMYSNSYDTTVTIMPDNLSITLTSLLPDNVTCHGGADGEITATASGGVDSNYSYSIVQTQGGSYSGTNTTGYFNKLKSGTYSVTAANRTCVGTASSITVDQPSPLSLGVPNTKNVTCNGGNNGEIKIAAAGGTGSYTYRLTPGNVVKTDTKGVTFSDLKKRNYTITVKNSNNTCDSVTSALIPINEPEQLALNAPIVINATCNGVSDGEITIAAVGGTGSYTYTLTPGNVIKTDTKGVTFSGLKKGNYSITVKNSDGSCDSVTSSLIPINEPALLALGTPDVKNVSCNGGNNGSITIAASGGTNSYIYTLTRGGLIISTCTDGVFNGLSASNSYQVSVQNANGTCSPVSTGDIEVTQPNALAFGAISPVDIKCNGNVDGKINVTANGGTKPYTFILKDNGSIIRSNTDGNFLDLGPSKNYSITVMDALVGCSEIDSGNITINQPSLFQLDNNPIVGHISCFGQTTGTIQISASGGILPYSYILKRGVNVVSNNSTGKFEGLPAANNYTITATDANRCRILESVSIPVNQPTAFVVSDLIIKNVGCFGQNSGSIKVIASGGKMNYSFTLLKGTTQIAQNATGLFENQPAGDNYYITAKDANGCGLVTLGPKIISQPSAALALGIPAVVPVTCFDGNNGKITIAANGGTPAYSYTLMRGGIFIKNNSMGEFSGLTAAANYSVKVTDANGCEATSGSIIVSQPSEFKLSVISSQAISCNGGSNGSVTLKANGGMPYGGVNSYEFSKDGKSWVASSPEFTFNSLSYSTNPFYVRDSNGCIVTAINPVTQPNPILLSDIIVANVKCKGASDGKLSFRVSGGTGLFTMTLLGTKSTVQIKSNIINAAEFDGLKADTYTLEVKDANNCNFSQNFVIQEPVAPISLAFTPVLPSCNGYSNGAIEVVPAGGWGKNSYIFANLSNGSAYINGKYSMVRADTYQVSVTDSLGCTFTDLFTLIEPSKLEFLEPSITNLRCNNDGSGAIEISAKGGTPSYSFSLFNGATPVQTSTDGHFTYLQASGEYSVMVTDSEGCSINTSGIAVIQPDALDINIGKSNHNGFNIKCHDGLDSVSVVPTGGTGLYTITFNGQAISCPTSGYTIKNLSKGDYTIYLNDANSCSDSTKFTLTEPTLFTLHKIDIDSTLCNGTSNGAVEVIMQGGVSTYTFGLQDSQNNFLTKNSIESYRFTGLPSGEFTFSAMDKNGCSFTLKDTIYQPEPIKIKFKVKDVSCFGGSNGEAEATIIGGTAPYTHTWTGVENTIIDTRPMISEREAFDYHFLFTDSHGCSTGSGRMGTLDTLARISNPKQPLALSANINKVLCYGDETGEITFTGTEGWRKYKYSLNGSAFSPTSNYNSLPAGDYIGQVIDSLGCVVQKDFRIEQNDQLIFNSSKLDVTCFGGQKGRIQIEALGGSPNYTYHIGNKVFSGDTASLPTGDYTVKVSDMYGCEALPKTITISSPPKIGYSALVANSFCNQSNGSILVTPTGGVAPYRTDWIKDSNVFHSGDKLENQFSGTYNFNIVDGNGCSESFSHDIADDGSPSITLNYLKNTLCPGGSDGIINLRVDQGVLPYRISLFNDKTELFTGNYDAIPDEISYTGLSASNYYRVEVIDGNNCKSFMKDTILSPSPITATSSVRNITCFNDNNGTAELTVSGGTSPYQTKWLNSSNNEIGDGVRIENLSVGAYTYQITDSHNCTYKPVIPGVSNRVEIKTPTAELKLGVNAVTNVSCFNGQDGEVRLTPQGGWGSYKYSIDLGITWLTSPNFNKLKAGDYRFMLADELGCKTNVDTRVNDGIPLSIHVDNISGVTCFGTSTGALTLSASGGSSGIFSYSINNGTNYTTNRYFNGLAYGDYPLRVRDNNGCEGFKIQRIEQPAILEASIAQIAHTACSKSIGSALVVATGGTRPYSYSWSNGQRQDLAVNLATGSYNVEIIDKNGCKANASASIKNLPGPVITLLSKSDATCSYLNNGSISTSITSGTPPLNLAWKGIASTSSNVNNLKAGIYTAIATDHYGCKDSLSITIAKPDSLIISTQKQLNPLCFGYANGVLETVVNGGTAPYSYLWSNGSQVSTSGEIPSGDYSLQVTDSKGCIANGTYVLVDPPLLRPNLIPTVTICANQESYQADAGIEAASYLWTSSDGFVATSRIATLRDAGIYSLKVWDTKGCLGQGSLTLLRSDREISANFIVAEKAYVGDTLVLIEMSWPIPEVIEWDYPASFRKIDGNEYSVYLVPEKEGTYDLKLTSHVGECWADINKAIIIEPARDKGNNLIQQRLIESVTAYPNPNNGNFSVGVELSQSHDAVLEIYSLYGQRLQAQYGKGLNHYNFVVNHFRTPGIYLVRVTVGTEQRSLRVVVQ